MNRFLMTVTVLFSLNASAHEFAQAETTVRYAELPKFIIAPEIQGNDRFVHATVAVDVPESKVTLSLQRAWSCPPGRVCAAVMPRPVRITLPIVSVETDHCNIRVYTAMEDKRPVDGDMKRVMVRDTTKNVCPHRRALDATEVIYDLHSAGFGGPVVNARSTFSGEALQPVL